MAMITVPWRLQSLSIQPTPPAMSSTPAGKIWIPRLVISPWDIINRVAIACKQQSNLQAAPLATQSSVIDGDTIDVLMDGLTYRVRHIGIDTPETVHPTRGVEPCGKEASERNRPLMEGKRCW